MIHINPKNIKEIIKLKYILNDQDMVDVLLVLCGFKPAAMIEISHFKQATPNQQKSRDEINVFKKILRGSAVKYWLRIDSVNQLRHGRFSYIAKNQTILSKVIAADAEQNTRKRRLLTGKVLGYPKTAIQSFADGKYLVWCNFPPNLLQKKSLRFLRFRLSKKHWRNEYKYVEKIARIIERIAPDLFRRIVKESGR